jgi:hypothetical protein
MTFTWVHLLITGFAIAQILEAVAFMTRFTRQRPSDLAGDEAWTYGYRSGLIGFSGIWFFLGAMFAMWLT